MSHEDQKEGTSADDLSLPSACVGRLVKNALLEDMQCSKDARAAISRAAAIFIMYIVSGANEFCRQSKRQTVSATDILAAISESEFDDFIEPLEKTLSAYRDSLKAKRQQEKSKIASPAEADKDTAEARTEKETEDAEEARIEQDTEETKEEKDGQSATPHPAMDIETKGEPALDDEVQDQDGRISGKESAAQGPVEEMQEETGQVQ